MAYNLFGESSSKINWKELNESVQPFRLIEYVPMPGMGLDGGDAIGLSIPAKNTGVAAYQEFLQVTELLRNTFHFTLYVLYYGTIVDSCMLEQIKADIT